MTVVIWKRNLTPFNQFHWVALITLLAVLIVGCSPRGQVFENDQHAEGASIETVYVVSQQKISEGFVPSLGAARSPNLYFGRAEISIPPTHKTGAIEWARSQATANPNKHFVVHGGEFLPSLEALAASVNQQPGHKVAIMTHGYNTNPSEALYLAAQLKHDYELEETLILFIWPSSADIRGYVYDRDSVLYSRDSYARLIKAIGSKTNKKIELMGHSLGGLLTMEMLRQLALTGERDILHRIGSVGLVEPDIEPDIFRRQLAAIGNDLPNMSIIVTQGDRALDLSAFLTGRDVRLGTLTDPEEVKDLPVTFFDLSSLAENNALNHGLAFQNARAIEEIRRLREHTGGFITGAVIALGLKQ